MKIIRMSAILEFLVPGLLLIFVVFDKQRSCVKAAAINYGDDSANLRAPVGASTEGLMKTTRANEKSSENRETATNAIHSTQAATVDSTTASSDVKQFFQTVQCTLEKAKPWVEEIEKEAKRLEQSAKRFGEGVINKFSHFMEKLIPNVEYQVPHTDSTIANMKTNNNNNNNIKKQSVNPVQSLLNTIIDGFGAVVSVVGSGVVGVATSMKPQLVHVVPVKDSGHVIKIGDDDIETPGAGAGHGNRLAASDHTKIISVDASDDAEIGITTSPATVDTTSPALDAVAVAVATIEHANELENQIIDSADNEKCPFGFVVDAGGSCQPVDN